MPGPFVHNIDPVITQVNGIYLWWYGASYTLGFLGALSWVRHNRDALGLDSRGIYALVLLLASGVLLGGRAVEVLFYEWAYYSEHPGHIPAVWLGGMSTHGILLGATVGTLLFCRLYRLPFLAVADVLAIAGAYIMGMGRIGNFIDGQIAGSVTDVWWAVKFPDLEGYRHPVVLYDGIKNLLLVPFLMLLRNRRPPRGMVFGHFVLWYGFLRIFVDLFREYRTAFLGFPPGQEFNLVMAIVGLAVIAWSYRRNRRADVDMTQSLRSTFVGNGHGRPSTMGQRAALIALLLLPLVIPSDWTQDVPNRYGARHPGMRHSWLYPPLPPTGG